MAGIECRALSALPERTNVRPSHVAAAAAGQVRVESKAKSLPDSDYCVWTAGGHEALCLVDLMPFVGLFCLR